MVSALIFHFIRIIVCTFCILNCNLQLTKFRFLEHCTTRLECMVNKLDNLRPKSVQPEDLKLDPAVFKNVLNENIVIINKVLENAFIIPAFDTFCEHITRIYEKCKLNTDGKPADYIPQLAAFGSEHWGVAVCTVDGQRFSIGHADVPFTIQSVSQAVTYAICLNELGTVFDLENFDLVEKTHPNLKRP